MIDSLLASAPAIKQARAPRLVGGQHAHDRQSFNRWLARWIAIALLFAVAVLFARPLDSPLPATTAVGVALCGCLIGWFASTSLMRARDPLYERRPEELSYFGRTVDTTEADRVNLVKAALEQLREHPVRRASALASGPGQRSGGGGAHDVRSQLLEVVAELASSPRPRDSEAGRLLLDYYVKRVGSHEVIMQRLCLSRPTFYRRLKHGLRLVSRRLDEMAG